MNDRDDLEERLSRLAGTLPADRSLEESVMRHVAALPLPRRAPGMAARLRAMLYAWWPRQRVPRLAAAGAFAVVLALGWHALASREAVAAQVLERAERAMAGVRAVYLKLAVRTLPRDNFEMIDLAHDLIPVEMWKDFTVRPHGRWRIQKEGRVAVMDGSASLLHIEPDHAAKGGVDSGFVVFLRRLLDVDRVIHEATVLAFDRAARADLLQVRGADGRLKTVITMEVAAQGDFRNTYLLNKTIAEANTRRVYRFDSETNLLEGLDVFVHTERGDVLALSVTEVRCNPLMSPELFTIPLPPGTVWSTTPAPLPEPAYELMTPRESAQAFFQSCADENWTEMRKFWYTEPTPSTRALLGSLKVVSIGAPFRSGLYSGWFIPYEVRLRDGGVKKHNLAVRNDNPGRRYVVDGGI